MAIYNVFDRYLEAERDDIVAAFANDVAKGNYGYHTSDPDALLSVSDDVLIDYLKQNFYRLYGDEFQEEIDKIEAVTDKYVSGEDYRIFDITFNLTKLTPPANVHIIEDETVAGFQQAMLWLFALGNPLYVIRTLARWKLMGLPSFMKKSFVEEIAPYASKPWFKYEVFGEFYENAVLRLKNEICAYNFIKLEDYYKGYIGVFDISFDHWGKGILNGSQIEFVDIRALVFGP
jgi:hypothetical protein